MYNLKATKRLSSSAPPPILKGEGGHIVYHQVFEVSLSLIRGTSTVDMLDLEWLAVTHFTRTELPRP